jgi:hypothetical protein
MGENLVKVAISFIATGSYLNYLPKWYEYLEEYFLPGIEKKVLVFTDGDLNGTPENVKVYQIEHKEWPFITLERFETLLLAREEIEKYDWFVFLDADTLVVSEIKPEEFFDESKPYIGAHHPCHYLKMPPHDNYPGAFEINKKSRACIEENSDFSVYYQGCVWGGKVPEVIDMIEELDKRTREDLENDVIAIWHDESHLNKFYLENANKVKVLSSSYAFPNDFAVHCKFPPKIVHSKDFSNY